MKKLFAIACCLFLSGCGGFVFPGPDEGARMDGTSQAYPLEAEGGYEQPQSGERMTSTCTMSGRGAVCR